MESLLVQSFTGHRNNQVGRDIGPLLLVIKTKDPKVREAALQAAQSKEFAAFLDKGKWINVNASGKFAQKDVDNFNAYIKKMNEYNY